MDLFFKYFPYPKFALDMDDAIFANLYYKAGEPVKANKMVEMISKVYTDQLEYYYTFTGDFAPAYKDDIQQSLEMLRSLQMLTTQNKEEKLAKKMEDNFNREAAKFKQ